MISWRVNLSERWSARRQCLAILDLIQLGGGGVEGCPSEVDVRLGCGVLGQFPRGGWRGADDSLAPKSRLIQQPQCSSL